MTVLAETITDLDCEVELDPALRSYRTMQELLDDLHARADEARRAAGTLPWTITSVVNGNNADLIAHIAPLYIPPGSLVRDVTWGRARSGRRWIQARSAWSAATSRPMLLWATCSWPTFEHFRMPTKVLTW